MPIRAVTRWLGTRLAARRPAHGGRPRPLALERLEDRAVPADYKWTGLSPASHNWLDARNWVDVFGTIGRPENRDDVVFPSPSESFQNIPGLVVNSLRFESEDSYVRLMTPTDFNSISSATGTNHISGPADLRILAEGGRAGAPSITAAAGELEFTVRITEASPGSRVDVEGAGSVRFTEPHAYTGSTYVGGGTLILDSADPGVLQGDLRIGRTLASAPDSTRPAVVCRRPDQLSGKSVTVTAGGVFDANGFDQRVDDLFIGVGEVRSGSGTITLDGDIVEAPGPVETVALPGGGTEFGISDPPPPSAGMVISGRLALSIDAAHQIILTNTSALTPIPVTISADISGPGTGLTTVGPGGGGRLTLTGNNTYTGRTILSENNHIFLPFPGSPGGDPSDTFLRVDGNQPASPVTLKQGVLGGSGTVGRIFGTGAPLDPSIASTGAVIAPGLGAATTPVTLNSGSVALVGVTLEPVTSADPAGARDVLAVTGTVDVRGGVLTPVWLGGDLPAGGSVTLIANDGTDPVEGLFTDGAGLAILEGASVRAYNTSQVFTLSYQGGDGNDVVLTVPPVVSPPPPPPPPLPQPKLTVAGAAGGIARRFTAGADRSLTAFGDQIAPFPGFTGDVRGATGDFNGDGVADSVLVTGPGTKTVMAVVSGRDGSTLLPPTDPFGDANFTSGGFVTAGGTSSSAAGPAWRAWSGCTAGRISRAPRSRPPSRTTRSGRSPSAASSSAEAGRESRTRGPKTDAAQREPVARPGGLSFTRSRTG